jgi:hypothetical protein
LAAGNPGEAVQKFEAAARLDPSDITLKSSLEQAKAALEQSRQVARLVADAERALQSGDLAGALRIARQAAELAPAEKRAREIVARTEAALAEQERQSRLAEDLARARRLIEISSWDEAASVLDLLELGYPQLGDIRALREMLDAGRLAEQRQQKLSSGLTAARQDIQARNLELASSRLAALHAEFPNAADIEQLLRYVTSEIEAQRQRDVVERGLIESRALVQQNRFAAAAKVLQTALASYPTDVVLQRELRSVTTAHEQAERNAALNQALSSAKALQTQGSFEEALGPLELFSVKYGAEPAIEELRRTIERDREAVRRAAELREIVLRVNQLLSQGKAEEATEVLRTTATIIKDHPEITQLRVLAQTQLDRQIERQAALEQALVSADACRQQRDFDNATRILAGFTTLFGVDPKIAELERAIQQELEEADRGAEQIRRLIGRANEFLAEGKAIEATQLLRSRPISFNDHPEATRILQEAELQIRKQAEREAALSVALSSAASCQQQGRLEEALAVLDAFSRQYGLDGRVAALEQAIQSAREAALRASEIRELETRARSLLAKNDFEGAVALLKPALSLVNESRDLRELLSNAETALKAQQTWEVVEATVAEARSYVGRGEFQAAIETIDRGLKRFPFEAALQSARAEAVAAQATKQREEHRAQVIAEVNSLIAKHDYSRAFSVQEKALGKLSGDPQLLSLRAEIEAHRRAWEALRIEEEIQNTVRRAQELLTGKPAESVALMERLCAQYPNRPELLTQLEEAREALRQAAERKLIREAERLCEKSKFSEAIAKLRQADRDTSELQAARQRVESRHAAHVSEQIARGIQSAHEIAVRKPSQALRALEKLRQQFPGRPQIESAIEDCRQVLLGEERAREEARRSGAELSTAVDAAVDFPRAQIQGAEAQEPETEQARRAGPISRRWMSLAAGLTVAAVLAAAAWWIVHSKRVRPPVTLALVEVRTDPQGASVRIGDQSCVTPNCRLDIRPGTYNVQAQLEGYEPVQQALDVNATHPAELNLTLRPLPSPPPPLNTAGKLIVRTGLPDVLVVVDNLPRGRTDLSGTFSLPVEAKTHNVRVERIGYETGREQQVKIAERASETVVFKLISQMATLELRGAPKGVEVSANGTRLGTTDGGVLTAPVQPGDQSLKLTQGSQSHQIAQRFEPSQIVRLEWSRIAPQPPSIAQLPPIAQPSSPPPDSEAQDWERVRRSLDSVQLQEFLRRYPNGPHAADTRAALARLEEGEAWNRVDKTDGEGLRAFLRQYPDGAHKAEAQGAIDQIEKLRIQAEENAKQERLKQEELERQRALQQRTAQERAILEALDRFNAAFEKKDANLLKQIWPGATATYLNAIQDAKRTGLTLRLQQSGEMMISGDTASVSCDQTYTSQRGPGRARFTVTLRNSGGRWFIETLAAAR